MYIPEEVYAERCGGMSVTLTTEYGYEIVKTPGDLG